jgi:hypothetical protein
MRRAAGALVTLAVLIVASAAHAGAATAASGAAAVQRVLVISLPATSWSDIEAGDDPHLKQLLSQSAIADMITRAAGRKNSIAGGYTALGAGGRASAVTPLAPQAFEPSEPYGESTAGDVYRQRTGVTATSGLVHLGIDALVQENADGLYDPTIGALGDDLAKHRVPRAVIANGDGAQPVVDEPLPAFQRAAVNALMGSDGRVPGGAVGDELLEPDRHAPFGVRMDNDAAYRASQTRGAPAVSCWSRGRTCCAPTCTRNSSPTTRPVSRSRPPSTAPTSWWAACSPTSTRRTTRCSS